MKRLTLTSIMALCMACPAMANIDKDASTATCDSATIGATSGTAYMDTDWTANTINLDFYSDGEKISTGSCTYDGAIELPEDPEDKTGYTFGGWQLRRASAPSQQQQTTFDLSTLSEYIGTNGIELAYITNAGVSSTEDSNRKITTPDTYNLTESGEWAVEFDYGTIKGMALCSSTSGTLGQTGTPMETGGGQNCWCKVNGFDAEKDGTYLNASPSSWLLVKVRRDADDCADFCAMVECARNLRDRPVRRSVYYVSAQ